MNLEKKIIDLLEKILSPEFIKQKYSLECFKMIETLESVDLTNEKIKDLIEMLGDKLDE